MLLPGALTLVAAGWMAYRMGPQIAPIWRYDQRHQGRFKVGDAAPDVVLTSLEGSAEEILPKSDHPAARWPDQDE